MQINMDGVAVEVTKKSIKNVTLRIYPPDGLVKMSVPLHYKEKAIRLFIAEKLGWIKAKREQMQARPRSEELALQTGASVEFLGHSYLLILEEHHGPTSFQIRDELMHGYIKTGSTQEQIKNALNRWYAAQMETVIPDLLNKWQPIIGVKVNEWGIRAMKTRWGSCNTKAARVWLNLSLIRKPLVCLEYVLVHELVHLHETGHNVRFYGLMSKFMPEWRDYQFLLEGKTRNVSGASID